MGKYDQGWRDQQHGIIEEMDARMWRDVSVIGKITFGVMVVCVLVMALLTVIHHTTEPSPPVAHRQGIRV